MRIRSLLIAPVLVLASAAAIAAPVSLVQNEYDFAQAVADHGIRDGFLMYLDRQAITLTPRPVSAYEAYSSRRPSSTKLSWYPVYALVSSSGDFGVDTGPWTATWVQDGKQQDAYGDWLSVWQRDQDGRWHALFDGGIDHAAPTQPAEALGKDAKVSQLAPPPVADAVRQGLARAEAQFSATAGKSGLRAAYAARAADELRLMQDGSPVLSGKAAIMRILPAQPGRIQWVPAGSGAASSGDLGYVYGMTYKAEDPAHATPQGSYMHVWRRDQDDWKLLIDLELPIPPRQ